MSNYVVENISINVQKDSLFPLIEEYSFGRYCADWTLDIQLARQLELQELCSYAENNPETCWVAKKNGYIVGFLGLKLSEWDTDFWGMRYVSIDKLFVTGKDDTEKEKILDNLFVVMDEWCSNKKIKFLCSRVDIYDLPSIRVLENHNFHFIESTCTNSHDIRKINFQLPEHAIIRSPQEREYDTLVNMTEDAFLTHRFYADSRFSKNKVDEMYRQWVLNGLQSSLWTTIVLEEEGQASGFFIYRVEDLSAILGLKFTKWRMAVLSPQRRGKGSGISLFQGAMQYVKDCSDIVDSGLSIRNIRSFNLHNKLNFRIINFSSTYYKWIS